LRSRAKCVPPRQCRVEQADKPINSPVKLMAKAAGAAAWYAVPKRMCSKSGLPSAMPSASGSVNNQIIRALLPTRAPKRSRCAACASERKVIAGT
jgi:hypothetical protein